MKLLRYHLHYSQWHPWVCLDLLAQFPNSAWGFLIPICPKEHLMYFYHHYQWPEVKNMNIYWFQILFWNHGHKKLWWCSFTSRALRMFSCVRQVPPIVKVWVDIDIVCYNNYYLQSWTEVLGRAMQYSFFLSFWVPSLNSASFLKLIFLAVLPPPYTELKFRKNSGYMHPTLFVGWGEGLDLCELEMPRNAKVSQDFCPWL